MNDLQQEIQRRDAVRKANAERGRAKAAKAPKSKYIHLVADMDYKRKVAEHPSIQPEWLPRKKFTDRTANGLTQAIITFLRLQGNQCERISSSGRFIQGEKYTDVLGHNKQLPGKYIPPTTTKGTADVSSTIMVLINDRRVGISAKWEVKMNDKQSLAQEKYQQSIEQAGGYYFLVHSFDEFISGYKAILKDFNTPVPPELN